MEKEKIEKEFYKRKDKITKGDIKDTLDNEKNIKKLSSKGALKKLLSEIETMYSLLKDYWKGDYREVSWNSIASIVVALTYIVSPIDLIPDFIPVIGLFDDALVVMLCLKLIDRDIKKYKKFKNNQKILMDSIT